MKAINKKSVEHPGVILRQVTTGILRFQCPPQVRRFLASGHAETIQNARCVYRHSFTWTKNRLSVEVIRVRSSHSEDRKF